MTNPYQHESEQPNQGDPYAGGQPTEQAVGPGGQGAPQYQASAQYSAAQNQGSQDQGGQYHDGWYGGAQYQGAQDTAGQQPMSAPTDNERMWAVLAHISVLVGTLISVGTIGWLIPLIIFLVFKDSSRFVRQASAGALNFAIIMVVANIVGFVLVVVGLTLSILLVPLLLALVGGLIMIGAFAMSIIVPILAAVSANKGEPYTYPLTPQMVR